MLHEVHQGMSAMKAVARSYFWWPGLDEGIEMLARRCEKCACNKKNPPVAAGKPWPATLRPWSRLHIDYAGPFMGINFFIVVDAHSKWVEVKITSTINAIRTIELMREIFATHGIPDTIVSDNGRTFVSEEFEKYLKLSGIKHIRTAPYHPSSNEQAESNILSRHIDQLHKRVSETPTSLKSNITPVAVTSVAQSEEQDDQVSAGHSSNEYILPDSQVERSLEEKDKRDETLKSRPYRQRQPPKRLRDYLMGEEL
ncbi:uncharacterized protein K02A2.6-like [Teleopsis dalmanni]|uniref:uncharacterized protein K02A2.6-like n=1 Tax=Teleopsis dalmanni TaxID=139649 RepID=UPI0018CEB76F|nr:uncharacterized protein K02A2.6-like [Teleopsis dalmanni]